MQMLGGFAGLALLLGAIGIYGVLSYSVTERRQEIGVRLALGARPGQVAAAVLRPLLVVAAAGVGVGLVAALAGAPLLDSLLFGIDGRDPGSYALVGVTLLAVALVAAWRPLQSAARLDPLVALRES
jgi:ABC-type antimicrobial peptide transport system permease subunit